MDTLRRSLTNLYIGLYTNRAVSRVRLALQRMDREYQRQRETGLQALREGELRERRVLSGPFAGLHYSDVASLQSGYYPKLLGTYELELHRPIEGLIAAGDYEAVVDVGAAEGYYAVGLAMRCPRARVFAFDIDPASEGLVDELAGANGVAERIEFRGECTGAVLEELAGRFARGLVLSDCEGYERQLFQTPVIAALRRWDLLIETHDSSTARIAGPLRRRLAATHRTTVIRQRRRTLRDFPAAGVASPLVRLAAMNEGRGWRSRWLCCKSRAIQGRTPTRWPPPPALDPPLP